MVPNTTSAAGKMVFRMLAVLAEFERDLVSERTVCAMAHKKSKGERVGKVPFGFELAADGVQLVANADEQRALKLIAQLRQKGYTLRDIANELTRRGIKPKENKATDGKTNSQDGDQEPNTQSLGRSGNV